MKLFVQMYKMAGIKFTSFSCVSLDLFLYLSARFMDDANNPSSI